MRQRAVSRQIPEALALPLGHFVVETAPLHESQVRAGFHDPALVHHDDQVGTGDRAEAVGDDAR
jgi:hypothetical protein